MQGSFIKKFLFALLKMLMFFALAIVLSIEDASDAEALDGIIHSLAWVAGLVCAVNLVWKCIDSGADWKVFVGFVAIAFLGNIISALAQVVIVITGGVIVVEGLSNLSYVGGYFKGAFSYRGTNYNRVIAFCKLTYPVAIALVGACLIGCAFSFYAIFVYAQIACYVAAFAHILEAVMLVCLKKQGYID